MIKRLLTFTNSSSKKSKKYPDTIDGIIKEFSTRHRESRKVFSQLDQKLYWNYLNFLKKHQYTKIKNYLELSHKEVKDKFIAKKNGLGIKFTALAEVPSLSNEHDVIDFDPYCSKYSIVVFYDKKEKILRPKLFCASRIMEQCQLLTQRLDILKETFVSCSEFENFMSNKNITVSYVPASYPIMKLFGRYKERTLDLVIHDTKSSDFLTLMVRGKIQKVEVGYRPADKITINKEFYDSFFKEFNRVHQIEMSYTTPDEKEKFFKLYHMITV